jgi:POT family proton-dependent oligopeptide transporter
MFSNHPKGLKVLFYTELWERMSYYGMRGLLVLFMTASISEGGLNYSNVSASAIYGIYASLVYLLALPGGWIGDRILGQQKAILYGGLTITLGHFILAINYTSTFFFGLAFVVLGTGLLKPNISALVGGLYEKKEELKQSGFTLFYMAINVGSILGFFICGYLGEKIGWHYGFSAAGFGMALGIIRYKYSLPILGKIGLKPNLKITNSEKRRDIRLILFSLTLIFIFLLSGIFGVIKVDPIPLANILTLVIASIAILYFLYIFLFGNLNTKEKKNICMIIILFISSAFFWAGFDQAGSSFSIFAKEYTDRFIFNWEYPSSWIQILNPVLVVVLSPFIASLWITLGKKMLDPSLPFKFGMGLILMAIGFLFVAVGANVALANGSAGVKWLLLTYLFHTLGELTISPIGLAAISDLSPKKYVGQLMGIWFLGSSLGAIIAGLLSGQATNEGLISMPILFNKIAFGASIFGLILIIISRPLNKLLLGKH